MQTRDWKKWAIGGGLMAGLAVLGGARFLMREKATPEPDFATVTQDGDFAIRDYGSLWIAQTRTGGDRRDAIRTGFRTLADYIFGRSHDGDEVPMTVPVLQQRSGADSWSVRFVMPVDWSRADLPHPPAGVVLEHIAARRVALVRFDGKPEDVDLAAEEARLRTWLEGRDETIADDAPIYAFYNSPVMPGPLRRNEIWLTLAR